MGLFRKGRGAPGSHPIAAFWTWWAEEGHRIDPQQVSRTTNELTRRVAKVHPDLTWHFGPGTTSTHRLTVSAGGVAAVRPTAERWLRAAPPADATWEFRSSQEADPEAMANILEIAGHTFELASMQFRVESSDRGLRVHVGVHHPDFRHVDESARAQISYLVLDWLLGEDDVERWLGHVEPLNVAPARARTGGDVVAAVADVAARCDPDEWVVARWEGEQGLPGLASFRPGLRWVDHPTLDRHQFVSAPYAAQANGLPADEASLAALRDLEAELVALLGARGVMTGYDTHRGIRVFHAYTDGEDQNVDAALHDWASSRGLTVEGSPDPAWSQVRHVIG